MGKPHIVEFVSRLNSPGVRLTLTCKDGTQIKLFPISISCVLWCYPRHMPVLV